MGAFVFLGGLVAIGLAIVDHIHRLSFPIGFVYSPLFWFGYVAILTAATIVKVVREQEVLVIERHATCSRRVLWCALQSTRILPPALVGDGSTFSCALLHSCFSTI